MYKLSSLARVLLGAALTTPIFLSAAEPGDLALGRLVEQAAFWQKKGRDDLAASIWKKVLQADPNHPEALVELGYIEIRAGRLNEAEAWIKRARTAPSRPARLGELESTFKISGANPQDLSAARKEAAAGNSEQAIGRYKSILGDQPKPEGQIGLEYYQTLAGTPSGWDEARRGLESLAKQNPEDDRYLLALARHLTYREATRREGLRILTGLAGSGKPSSKDAKAAWRQALAWLGNSPSDRSLYAAYLQQFPGDEAIQGRLKQVEQRPVALRPSPDQVARQAGFQQLKLGKLDQAENKFTNVLAHNSQDVDALGGLGVVRLQQQRFEEALELLGKAVALDGKRSNWRAAKRSAEYWLTLQPVLEARSAGGLEKHEISIKKAIDLDSREPTARVLLADLRSEQGAKEDAIQIYRRVLREDPDNPTALGGLVSALIETGRGDEARSFVERLKRTARNGSYDLDSKRVAELTRLAEVEEKSGNVENALHSLEDALFIDPNSPWVRLALVRLYQRAGQHGAALAISDDLLLRQNDTPDVQRARAYLLSEQGRWKDALLALEQIPPGLRTPDLVRDQRRFWVNAQVDRSRQFYLAGQSREAQSILMHMEKAAGNDFGMLTTVAKGWSDIAQPSQALRVARQLARSTGSMTIQSRLQYAGVLLAIRQDRELLKQLHELSDMRDLAVQERANLNDLIVAYSTQQVDSLRESGRISEAYDILGPLLNNSTDARLRMALARLYEASGNPTNASSIAEVVVTQEPKELDHRLYAANVAAATRNYDRAEEHIRVALDIAPDNPRVLAAAGRIEKARGNLKQAMEYFQYAQALERDQRAFAGVPGNFALRLLDTPSSSDNRILERGGQKRGDVLPLPIVNAPHEFTGKMRQESRGSQLLPLPLESRPSIERYPDRDRSSIFPQPLSQSPLSPLGELAGTPSGFDVGYQLQSASYLDTSGASSSNTGNYSGGYRLSDRLGGQDVALANFEVPESAQRQGKSPVARTVDEEIQDIALNLSPVLTAGGGFRTRSGEQGMSRLAEFGSSVEARLPLDYESSLVLRVSPIILNSGTVALSSSTVATRFGSAGLGSFLVAGTFSDRVQEEKGVAVSVGVESERIKADLGVTPIGFPVRHILGGLTLSEKIADFSVSATANRRPVTDSLLSFAGTVDPLTGDSWGGVVKTGGRLDVTLGDAQGGLYASLGGYQLNGKQVKSNSEIEGGFGAYWKAYQTLDNALTLGVNLTGMSYQHNLSHFTLGHGGYFSPQRYVSLGMPFDLSGRRGLLSYQVGGDIGVRSIHQAGSAYYPADAGMQNRWEAQVGGLPSSIAGQYLLRYSEDNSSGVGYRMYGAMEYKVRKDLSVGGRLSFDNSSNYNQQQGLLYLRHSFDGLSTMTPFPPRSLRLFSQDGSL